MASELAAFIDSPAGITLLLIWTVLSAAGVILVSPRMNRLTGGQQGNQVQRVFRNSAIPIASQIIVRVVDLAVAIALLRLLGPTGNGQYAIAVVVWLYIKTFSDFGLALLATREVARDPAEAGKVIGETTIFRWVVLVVTAIPVAVYLTASLTLDTLAVPSALAIIILYLSIVPSSYGESVNAAMNGLERMEIAAAINVFVSFARAPLAVALGASSLGVPGVALAALITSGLSAAAFHRALRSMVNLQVTMRLHRDRAVWYARESWPLLINGLLVSLFFRVDVFIISAVQGDAALGVYDAAYKLINLATVIPAYATLAVFPLMTRRSGDPAALERAGQVTTYTLVTIAWMLVFGLTALSTFAIRVLAGSDYLPEAAFLLRILIWFAPLSFINGVIQYLLVATNEQRRLVPAFVAAVLFNFGANLVLVPLYGARASAALTILTEVVIFVVLVVVAVRARIGIDPWRIARRSWRPTVAGLGASLVALVLREQAILAIAASTLTFVAIGATVRLVGDDERMLFRRLLGKSTPNSV